jgi:hypothetical protein
MDALHQQIRSKQQFTISGRHYGTVITYAGNTLRHTEMRFNEIYQSKLSPAAHSHSSSESV